MLVLIIDDDPSMRTLFLMQLRTLNVDAKAAAHGAEGLEIALTQRPALIICDFNMPQLTGYDIWKTLRANEHTRSTPFILASSSISHLGIAMQYHSMIEEIRRDEAALVFAKDAVNRDRLRSILTTIQTSLPLRHHKALTAMAV